MSEAQQQIVAAAISNRLPAQWQTWIIDNLGRGCREADLVGVMVENGFEPGFAGAAVAVIRDLRAGPGATVLDGAPPSSYVCDPIRLGQESRLHTSDRIVDVGFMMLDPNVALLDNLLSAEECAELIERSKGKLKRSEVVNRETGGFEVNEVRTSAGTHFARGETPTIERIEARIAELTGIPVENGEPLQILHYEVGGEYLPHHDFFEPADPGSAVHTETGGQRVATLVLYLNTVEDGGATGFPETNLEVKAREGSAVYFEYLNASGELDSRCLHAGTPVRRGEKWIATKWLRERPYVRSSGQ